MIKGLIRSMHKSEEMCCVDSMCFASDRETLVSCLSYNAPRRVESILSLILPLRNPFETAYSNSENLDVWQY